MSDKQERFDLEAVYDEQINPLMAQIIAICKQHNMPMLASFLYRVDEDEQQNFCTTIINMEPRVSRELNRSYAIIREGLPENRPIAFCITTGGEQR